MSSGNDLKKPRCRRRIDIEIGSGLFCFPEVGIPNSLIAVLQGDIVAARVRVFDLVDDVADSMLRGDVARVEVESYEKKLKRCPHHILSLRTGNENVSVSVRNILNEIRKVKF